VALALRLALIFTRPIPAADGGETGAGETPGMELIVLAAFVGVLAYVAWKTPRRTSTRQR
jgi:hypothetical protein